ncbi:MAG: 50S ribosomal protein L32 [Candidatus Coatesbacteria bacterium]
MANPKRRFSKSRTRMRRSIVWRLEKPATSSCPRCKSPREPHRICRTCGYYNGRQVIAVGS